MTHASGTAAKLGGHLRNVSFACGLVYGPMLAIHAACITGFLYLPGQSYPEHGFGGWLQRLGAWAYVHE